MRLATIRTADATRAVRFDGDVCTDLGSDDRIGRHANRVVRG